MKKYLEILKRCPLFHTIAEPDLLAMLSCLGATVHPYEKNEPILTEGDAASRLGILLSGTAQIIRIDFYCCSTFPVGTVRRSVCLCGTACRSSPCTSRERLYRAVAGHTTDIAAL